MSGISQVNKTAKPTFVGFAALKKLKILTKASMYHFEALSGLFRQALKPKIHPSVDFRLSKN
jgi:hypothetical protein